MKWQGLMSSVPLSGKIALLGTIEIHHTKMSVCFNDNRYQISQPQRGILAMDFRPDGKNHFKKVPLSSHPEFGWACDLLNAFDQAFLQKSLKIYPCEGWLKQDKRLKSKFPILSSSSFCVTTKRALSLSRIQGKAFAGNRSQKFTSNGKLWRLLLATTS